MRASIVLLAASGMTNLAIAKRLGTTRVTVSTWRMRFATKRMDGLSDEPRPGAPRKIGDDKITEVVTATLETMPATATHWSTRSMAQASGLSVSSVHRIWQAFALSRCCPCAVGKSSGVPTTTNDMGQPRCSPRWT
jgi:transposase